MHTRLRLAPISYQRRTRNAHVQLLRARLSARVSVPIRELFEYRFSILKICVHNSCEIDANIPQIPKHPVLTARANHSLQNAQVVRALVQYRKQIAELK
jgi:hypothetical protein